MVLFPIGDPGRVLPPWMCAGGGPPSGRAPRDACSKTPTPPCAPPPAGSRRCLLGWPRPCLRSVPGEPERPAHASGAEVIALLGPGTEQPGDRPPVGHRRGDRRSSPDPGLRAHRRGRPPRGRLVGPDEEGLARLHRSPAAQPL